VSEFAPSTRLRNVPDGVSIVIPNWNHEYLLGRSVGSALRAVADLRGRGVPGEVLVIDDGSRDGSITLLRQLEALYFEDGLRVRLRGANSGLPAIPRNEGLRDALYRYVCYLDADDELIPENLYQFHRAIRATGAALVYGNMVGLAENPDANMLISNESYQQRMLSTNYIGAMSVMDRMQISDVGGNLESPTMVAREDWELHLHLAANGKLLVFVPIMMGIYYHDIPGSITKEAHQSEIHQRQQAYIRRVYNQLGIRGQQPLRTRHLRYHPDIGYL
jgi:glycosyltransferase involved in cell wall biosynthesis